MLRNVAPSKEFCFALRETAFIAGGAMNIEYGYDITVKTDRATPFHVLLDIHPDRRGDIVSEGAFELTPPTLATLASDTFGNRLRRFTARPGETSLSHRGVIRDSGQPDIAAPGARLLDVAALPAETLHFLQGSRYCETDKLSTFAWKQFGGMPRDYSLIEAICDFTHKRIAFNYADARATRTAVEALEERKGVCRDYAHLAVALCRALNIPARYVNGYLGDIGVPADPAPMDFSAWFEVYLEGGWYTFDARHNARRIGRLVIARGRDAADVPMLHSFGQHQLMNFHIVTRRIEAATPAFEPSAAA
jgi:transglutaminase-like putative cysteine protease